MKARMKTLAIRCALEAIALSRVGTLYPKAGGRGVIFTLHHVRPKSHHDFDPNAHLEILPEFLETAICVAKEAGLVPIHLSDLPNRLANDKPSQRYMCFTLDDGYKDNALHAAPIFGKHNVPYSIFICPGFVTRSRTMWWQTAAIILQNTSQITFDFGNGVIQLNVSSIAAKQAAFQKIATLVETIDENQAVARIDALARSLSIDPLAIIEQELMTERELNQLLADPLCSLGAHTMTHRNLARISNADLENEIERSCKIVSEYASKPVDSFAYPYGWARAAGTREFDNVKDHGIKVAVTTQPGVIKSTDTANPTGLHRISLNGHFQSKRYVAALISGIPFIGR